eukprot:COSAG02_NODE_526_length_20707_cov_11.431337_11_plen_80_part_00
MATVEEDAPSLAAWLAEIGAAEALAPLRNEEFETVAALRDLTGSAGEEGLADIEGTSVTASLMLSIMHISASGLYCKLW